MLALAKQLAAEMGVDVSTLIGANSRPREPDYPRKSNPPGIQGIAWPELRSVPSTKRLIPFSRESNRENRTTRRFHTARVKSPHKPRQGW